MLSRRYGRVQQSTLWLRFGGRSGWGIIVSCSSAREKEEEEEEEELVEGQREGEKGYVL